MSVCVGKLNVHHFVVEMEEKKARHFVVVLTSLQWSA